MPLRRLAPLAALHLILALLLAWSLASRAGFLAHAALHLLLVLPLGLVLASALRNPKGAGGRGFRLVLAAALLARVAFTLTPPVLSGDIHRVIWEGRVLAAGHDPWALPPDHPALAELGAALPEIRARVDYERLPAIYPPLAQLFGYGLTSLSTDPRFLKAALVGCEALLVLGLGLLLRERGLTNPLLLTAWIWNPLPLTEIAGSGHLDALGIGLLVFGVLAAERRWATGAAVLAAFSGLAKLAGFAALPLLLRRAAGGSPRRILLALGAALAVAGLAALPFRWSDLTFSLIHYARHWRFNESLFFGIEALAGAFARPAVGMLLALLLLALWTLRTRPSLACAILAGSVFLLSPVAHPWYLLWVLAFALLHPERRALFAAALTLSATVVLSYGPFWSAPAGDPWVLSPTLRLLEYLPPVAVAAWFAAGTRIRTASPARSRTSIREWWSRSRSSGTRRR